MAEKAFITPKVLEWARTSAHMPLETAAAKVPTTPEKLKEWEEGKSQPTIRQAEILAKAYRRPFALFFLPEVPRDFQPLQDFRKKSAKALGTASTFIIREIQQKQAWISDVYRENEEQPLSFVGKFSVRDNPIQIANDILETLNIDPSSYATEHPMREWISNSESKGIFISRSSFIHTRLKIDSEEIQGFTIADKYAPFIFVNSDDWDAPQLFTLIHEIAHIWIAESGISNEVEPKLQHKDKYHPVELFCNEIAANTLMPVNIMTKLEKKVFNSGKDIFAASKKMGVSSFAFLVRALNLNLISFDKYRNLKRESDIEFQAFLRKEEEKEFKQKLRQKEKGGGGPDYFLLLLNKNGQLFTKVVMDAFRGGFIEPNRASSLLNTQINNFSKLEAFLYK